MRDDGGDDFMAQVLKENQRIKIVSAAKKELLKKGYKDCSMRHIASKAHMTVGNLYRYYKNKDDLIHAILMPALNRLDLIIQDKTDNRIHLYENQEKLGLSRENILQILDALTLDLVLFYHDYREEMLILMQYSEAHQGLKKWLSKLIVSMCTERYALKEEKISFVSALAEMISSSMFDGVQKCFEMADNGQIKDESIEMLIRIYFKGCIKMLDFDEWVMEE